MGESVFGRAVIVHLVDSEVEDVQRVRDDIEKDVGGLSADSTPLPLKP